jgi:hypothetical protein
MRRDIMITSNRILLNVSGRESNPFDGANLVKKISGPPYAIIRVWDSKFAALDTIDVTA